jgi:hypothetical protein
MRIKSMAKPSRGLLVLVFLAIAAATAFGRGDQRVTPGPMGSRFALVLIDVDGLACSPCLAPLQQICRALPSSVQEQRILGVLTFRTGKNPDPRRGRIARTKWSGYSRANEIRFPVTVDESQSFNQWSEQGMTILLFDPETGSLKRLTAPFQPDVMEEIVRFLISPESNIMETLP